ncbi:serine proteinase inhibitor [Opisthorchis viverrini]|uniref:Serine proteinase inhibitor n=1 Tax=Opisthorchis viverrini TaxID=6198 RepID=A0A1S8X1L9_OPIVI|nr:serine proteinase inhibitor [Opisthorchis viverrini]
MCIRSDGEVSNYEGQPSQVLFTRNYLGQTSFDFPMDRNFLTCPINVLFLLATLFGSGATKGRTALEIGQTLQLRRDMTEHNLKPAMEEVKMLYRDLYHELSAEQTVTNDRPTNVIKIANGIFLKAGYDVDTFFNWSVQNEYFSKFYQLNFEDNVEAARRINSWVNTETKGLIPQLFQNPAEIPRDTRVALVNVLTFKDMWQRMFLPVQTTVEGFTMVNGRRIDVPMMSITEELPYLYDASLGIAMVRKFFKNGRYSFVVVMPTDKTDMTGMESVLSGSYRLGVLVEKQEDRLVSFKLPKFKLESTFSLIGSLESMGIRRLFQKGMADMTGITNAEKLYVNLMKQANVLKVDEAGVEAASAVVGLAVPMSLVRPEVMFHVNSTFVCIIYDEQLKMPIFASRISSKQMTAYFITKHFTRCSIVSYYCYILVTFWWEVVNDYQMGVGDKDIQQEIRGAKL